jgi:hypothetical protein
MRMTKIPSLIAGHESGGTRRSNALRLPASSKDRQPAEDDGEEWECDLPPYAAESPGETNWLWKRFTWLTQEISQGIHGSWRTSPLGNHPSSMGVRFFALRRISATSFIVAAATCTASEIRSVILGARFDFFTGFFRADLRLCALSLLVVTRRHLRLCVGRGREIHCIQSLGPGPET